VEVGGRPPVPGVVTARPRGVLAALAAAVLFGASTPAAKALLGSVHPTVLAGIFYLASGIALGGWRQVSRQSRAGADEAPLRRGDLGWLAGATVAGGIVGPILLMLGLRATPAATASLLLNLEGVFTVALAWFAFRENFDRRILAGMGLILLGGALLSWSGAPNASAPAAALAIAGACAAWALDNNLTRRISGSDPLQIASIKGLVAGPVVILAGLAAGAPLPGASLLVAGAITGALGYGLSLRLFIVALRHLGSARTGAYFSVAPFLGAGLSVLVFREALTPQFVVAGLLMAAGVWLHLTERHEHEHAHRREVHEHRHTHDEHHAHAHGTDTVAGADHSHWHVHEPLIHAHPHYPDIHHRHRHG